MNTGSDCCCVISDAKRLLDMQLRSKVVTKISHLRPSQGIVHWDLVLSWLCTLCAARKGKDPSGICPEVRTKRLIRLLALGIQQCRVSVGRVGASCCNLIMARQVSFMSLYLSPTGYQRTGLSCTRSQQCLTCVPERLVLGQSVSAKTSLCL